MKRFIEGADRNQSTLLPECMEDFVSEDNPIRIINVFIDGLNLQKLGFDGATPAATGRPVLSSRDLTEALSIRLSQSPAVDPTVAT